MVTHPKDQTVIDFLHNQNNQSANYSGTHEEINQNGLPYNNKRIDFENFFAFVTNPHACAQSLFIHSNVSRPSASLPFDLKPIIIILIEDSSNS